MVTGRAHPIRWLREHPAHADWLLALLLSATGLVFHLAGPPVDPADEVNDPTWWSVVLAVACVLPIGWRRVRPVEVVVAVTAAQVVFTALDFDGPGFIGVIVGLYSVGAHAVGRRRLVALGLVTAMTAMLFIAGLIVDELSIANFISSVIILVTAYVLGDNLRRRRDAASEMAERAERAERERDLLAHQRVTAERTRIARELHDIVAHSVSAMLIQATAARRSLSRSPEQTDEALENIEVLGRRAMDELRTTLDVLRAGVAVPGDGDVPDTMASASATAPQPTLADLPALIDEATDLPIDARLGDDLHDASRSVGLAGYRTVQEALTNIRRHAGEVRRVDVVVERRGDLIHVEVLDDGRGAAAAPTAEPGYGLQGMRERVEAVGGSVVAEHRVGGGWQVVADLPAVLSSTRRVEVVS